MKHEWKVNDWCFCEFKLQQIKDMKEGRVTEVTDGFFSHSGHSLGDLCFPLSLHAKRASDTAEHWSREMHKLHGLNFPDIHRKLVDLWADICEAPEKESTPAYEALEAFGKSVVEYVLNTKSQQVSGVSIYR